MGVKGMIVVPSQWPTKFEDVKTAEVQLSEVDDQIDVSVNHAHLAHAEWGQAPPWMSIKDALHPGANAIEIWITNGEYGGCGGTATLRLNGVTNPAYSWTWKEAENRPKGTTCFRSVKTLNLEP
jgi:hypothetical protein